jgi:hypothetical protein
MTAHNNLDDLVTKVQMLVEQNELLRRHNTFLAAENTNLEQEFVLYKRQTLEKEQELRDTIAVLRQAEQERVAQLDEQRHLLKAYLHALENGINELYQHRI